MKKKCLQSCLALGALVFVVGNSVQAQAMFAEPGVTISETMDHVISDSYSGQHSDPDPANLWDVVRFDVTNNNQALGVYGIMIGAKPGRYDWSGYSYPAMMFGNPWEPDGARDENGDLPYLPQLHTNNNGITDWTTSLFEVRQSATGNYYAYNPYNGENLPFNLPDTFSDYGHVYWFETTGPFMACSGDYCQDSVPVGIGDTFSFYVTGGLGSPFLYLTSENYNESDGSLTGAFAGSGMTEEHPVPVPPAILLFATGLAGLVGSVFSRKKRLRP